MIEVEETNGTESKEWDYPLLVQHSNCMIVLATNSWPDNPDDCSTFEGIVVKLGDSDHKIFEHSRMWDREVFTPYKGTLKLRNK